MTERGKRAKRAANAAFAAVMLATLASCTKPPAAQSQATPQVGAKPACHTGADAKGIAAGFFELFQDDPSCF